MKLRAIATKNGGNKKTIVNHCWNALLFKLTSSRIHLHITEDFESWISRAPIQQWLPIFP